MGHAFVWDKIFRERKLNRCEGLKDAYSMMEFLKKGFVDYVHTIDQDDMSRGGYDQCVQLGNDIVKGM